MAPHHSLLAASFLTFAAFHALAATELPLKNKELRCCTLIAEPSVFRNDRRQPHGLDGLAIDYLTKLQERTGFRCSSLKVYEGPQGSVGWSDFIGHMINCTSEDGGIINSPNCSCDIGVGAWFENGNRLDIDFLPAFMYDGLRVLVHVDSTSTSTTGTFFLTAFRPTVWVTIFILIFVFTFLKLLDRRFSPPDDSFTPLANTEPRFKRIKHFLLKSRILYRLRRATQSTWSKMIGQSTKEIEGDDSSTRQWVLNFTIVLFGLFLVLAYEAIMTCVEPSIFVEQKTLSRKLNQLTLGFCMITFEFVPSLCTKNRAALVQETVESKFRSVEDFKRCRIPPKDVCFVRGDVIEDFWKRAIAISDCHKGKNEKGPRLLDSYEEVPAKAESKECKFAIADGGTAGLAMHGRYCGSLVMVGEPFFRGGLSYVLPKGSEFMLPMRKATLDLREEDALDTLDQFFEKRKLCNPPTTPQLTFKKLQIFFILTICACVAIFLEMVLDPQTSFKKKAQDMALQKLRDGCKSSEKVERKVSVGASSGEQGVYFDAIGDTEKPQST